MKMNMKTILALAGLLAVGATALVVRAQDSGSQNNNTPGDRPMRGHRPPAPAIVRALDANHDGVIDASEIANASEALKTLDKNGDGKLTPDEFMGPRPQRPGGGQGKEGNAGADDNNLPPGPPPGDDGAGAPPPAGE